MSLLLGIIAGFLGVGYLIYKIIEENRHEK
jgi:uncharacterized membrane protein